MSHHVKDVCTRHRSLLQPCIQHDLNWVAKPTPQKSHQQSRITATDHLA
ncbi:hypothetical protein HMPREF9565_02280 [Cutibacterium acnes HL053PA2]|nr:hypothetical protein HMPREF9567_01667 [Cutibacterium acnes HL013PA1]EFS58570.1 hypothetical protein HMPREF9604_01588 [Cutibacterium acnes HL036PA1]EFS60098.1 hypothetical protein HMPREF9605_02327 [Cutibacterium acnes HL036PA2]EFS68682.1 hypothetical protein HMPREF9616_01686 [Cutibacterium acnes HL007PA1]EFS82424.1 hypothetical protein HMPREF9598_00873 [Cutibacterium acnes HL050PA1]EFT03964.1 hypothetical protein HMPREF9614_02439 [Cutibacterium acnes HL002PA2]EFT06526.1 hypothetical protein